VKRMLKILGVLAVVLVVAFFVFRVPDTDPEEMWAKYGAPPSQKLSFPNGRTYHIRDEGPRDAPVIVLLHGSNADLHTWQKWTDALDTQYRVIRYDQRGHGLTGAVPGNDYSQAAFVDDVEDVADALKLRHFVLAGNSMGGGIAMAYALKHPERLDALVLVDAGGAPIKRKGGGNIIFNLAGKPIIGDLLSQLLPRSLVRKSFSQSVANQAVVTDAAVDRYWELGRYPGNRAATRQRFGSPRHSFTAQEVAAMQVPTLVMWGEKDALIPFDAANWYMARLPHATLIAYPDIGHIPMEEAADQSVADLKGWLAKTLPAISEKAQD
jgi:pimeloyl-ACP methyl ester carboxylesterase